MIQVLGCPKHIYVDYIIQVDEHPSDDTVFPSSHYYAPISIPSPQYEHCKFIESHGKWYPPHAQLAWQLFVHVCKFVNWSK